MGEKPRPNDIVIKQRWDTQAQYDDEAIEVVEDENFKRRMKELREQSNDLNRILQKKLEQSGLPYYSWNKGTSNPEAPIQDPKILRLAILLRPEFYASSEEKNRQTRYNTGDEQLTIFLHLTPDREIQEIRLHKGFGSGANANALMADIISQIKRDKESVTEYLKNDNQDALADYFVDIFRSPDTFGGKKSYSQAVTDFFKRAFSLKDTTQAITYFGEQNEKYLFYQSPEIIRNLAKVALQKILESKLKESIKKGIDLKSANNLLQTEAKKIIEVKTPQLDGEMALGTFIPHLEEHTAQTIQQLIKAYKPKILGWEK
jgi:hypothetical protein